MKDEEIIALLNQRNELAVLELEKQYGSFCFSVAYNILKSKEDTEECINETWLRTWNSIPPGCPDNLKLYLVTIARNIAFSRYRRNNAKCRGGGEIPAVLDELAECVAGQDNPEDKIMGSDLRQSINYFLGKLADRERDIFLRRYFFVESPAQIAQRYGMREGNVSVILTRIRKKLRKHLIQEGFIYDK